MSDVVYRGGGFGFYSVADNRPLSRVVDRLSLSARLLLYRLPRQYRAMLQKRSSSFYY